MTDVPTVNQQNKRKRRSPFTAAAPRNSNTLRTRPASKPIERR